MESPIKKDEETSSGSEEGRIKEREYQLNHADEDGRNREWEDRARVNLEEVPEGTKTNIERDFEPERLNQAEEKNRKQSDDTVY